MCLVFVNAQNQGVTIKNKWNTGIAGDIFFTPTVDLHGWKIRVKFNYPINSLEVHS